ncbi:DNA polymerase III subunit alpha [Candidatus Kaiserbacteria bacterium]|nr:DNA polymerase III subunit alpha [Candidatus Kaiserbacteria bacterium]
MSDALDFVHLHNHSHYSLLEALPNIKDLVEAAKADGQTALALTDNGNMYGAIEFYKECKKKEIKPIIGVDFYVAPRTRDDKEHRVDDHTFRLVLLAKNEPGYRNLLKLVSRAYLEGFYYRPRVDRALLKEHAEGLIAILPSFAGEHAKALKDGAMDRAREAADWYQHLYGDDLYMEITHHPEIEGHEENQKRIEELAREMKIPLVAAHDTYYLHQEDAIARELVNKIRTGSVLNRDLADNAPNFSFLSQADMRKLFKKTPEAIDNTHQIAQMCDLELELGKWYFPDFPIPAGSTHDDELRKLTYHGFELRGMAQTPETIERVEYELGVISKKGYSPYYLVVSDLLTHAKSVGIYTNTRGSAAGSLVSYLCGITTVNPLEYQLPFERFLNPERPSPPDIDMDIADDRRDDLIDYARRKYGEDHVAQIGTFGTMMARAAVRDVARALGHSYALGDKIAKIIPFGKQGFPVTIEGALKDVPELAEVYKHDLDAREVLDLAQKVEGNARHVGVHAAGVVIGPMPVTDFVPVQLDPKSTAAGVGKIITQYDMHAVEEAGLLKYDFLGLKNLSILADSVERVRARLGVEVNMDTVPIDDAKTFAMLARGETLGTFQLAGEGMTNHLVHLKPTTIHDINAMVALYRPGPMAFIPDYIERKHDASKIKFLDPRMQTILDKSYGVITYQDDVLMIAIQLAGYSWLEADKFRKAIGKKIPEEMAKQKDRFQSGCLEHGMKPEVVKQLWDQIETFAAYGFNKAHAASYGNLAYKTAYMKANFPVDYMASLLTADAGDVEKISEIVTECKRMGIAILPPSVNASRGTFTVVDASSTEEPGSSVSLGTRFLSEAIRFGLYSIKNFGTGVADSIIKVRDEGGVFTDIADFLSRMSDPSIEVGAGKNLNKKSLESLIQCGALDELAPLEAAPLTGRAEPNRNALLANIELLLGFHRLHTKAPSDQGSLFGGLAVSAAKLHLPDAPPASKDACLAWEKELLGLYVSGHPLDKHAAKLSNAKNTIKHAKAHLRGIDTVIGGFVETVRTILTKKGEKMAFIKIADLSDTIEVVAFPRTYKEYETLLVPGQCVALKGKIEERNDEMSFMVDKARAL